jgi:pyrroloquinoline-quinone synthase
MDVLDRLDETRRAINVLEHPFYRRWNRGELSAEELGLYAGEYRHAVHALARASAIAAEKAAPAHAEGLRAHAAEEEAHVDVWEQFARAAGAGVDADGDGDGDGRIRALVQTDACARSWTAGDDVLEHLAVLYAIEAGQPEISATKLAGLTAHYGYDAEDSALEYFTLHERLDVEHARQARELISELMAGVAEAGRTADRMVHRAREALLGNWRLLDGVEGSAAEAVVSPAAA